MKLISIRELDGMGVSYSRAHIYRLVRAGKFPKPIKLGENRIAWVEAEVDEWINNKIAERDADMGCPHDRTG